MLDNRSQLLQLRKKIKIYHNRLAVYENKRSNFREHRHIELKQLLKNSVANEKSDGTYQADQIKDYFAYKLIKANRDTCISLTDKIGDARTKLANLLGFNQ